MYKLLATIFIAIILLIAATHTFELHIGKDYVYVKADFPRFADKTWFGFEIGKKGGFEGLIDDLQSKVSSSK